MVCGERTSPRPPVGLLLAVFALWVAPAYGQYDWSQHIGPRPTGFEAAQFGSWDLEILSLRGMVERHYYESDALYRASVQSISETTRAVRSDGEPVGPPFRMSRTHVDRDGRVRRIEYLDPLTTRVVQRETFAYDDAGRLVEWSRSRPVSEVAVASITRTEYPGSPPYGMAQTFSYFEDGALREWRACVITLDQRLQDCAEDYLLLDRAGLIVEFGGSGEVTKIDRDVEGNAVAIEVLNTGSGESRRSDVSWEEGVQIESRGDEIVGRSYYDDGGRLVQYQAVSAESPEYYATVSWGYDTRGRIVSVTKGFDSWELVRDDAGRLVEVNQTVVPQTVRRKYDTEGRIVEQQPPLFFRRMNPEAPGVESFTHNSDGLLTEITVIDEEGAATAKTVFDYALQRRSAAVTQD